jgi:hypothetical protein
MNEHSKFKFAHELPSGSFIIFRNRGRYEFSQMMDGTDGIERISGDGCVPSKDDQIILCVGQDLRIKGIAPSRIVEDALRAIEEDSLRVATSLNLSSWGAHPWQNEDIEPPTSRKVPKP